MCVFDRRGSSIIVLDFPNKIILLFLLLVVRPHPSQEQSRFESRLFDV